MAEIKLFTIGFTQKTAEKFFSLLKNSDAHRIIDVRLSNTSQLSGFAKRDDLKFFAHEICGMEYIHIPELAPTKEILDAYKKEGGDWGVYEREFKSLMDTRHIELTLSKEVMNGACLLCSEDKPEHCHRRLVADYLKRKWGENLSITHLV